MQTHRRWALLLVIFGALTALPIAERADGQEAGAVYWVSERANAPKLFAIGHRALAMDSQGHPHAAYGGDFLYYAHNDGTGWTVETVLDDAGVGRGASLALDANDKAHILHADAVNARILYTTNVSGTWKTEVVFQPATRPPVSFAPVDGRTAAGGIAVAADGTVHVTYDDITGKTLYHATSATGAWVAEAIETSDRDVPFLSHSALVLDPAGKVHVAFARRFEPPAETTEAWPRADLVYATNRSGAWVSEVASGQDDATDFLDVDAPSLVLDSLGHAHIACVWIDATIIGQVLVLTEQRLAYLTNASGAWMTTPIPFEHADSFLTRPSLAIDSRDRLRLAARPDVSIAAAPLFYGSNETGTWVLEEVRPDVSGQPSIAVDGADDVRILQLDRDLLYYDGAPGAWNEHRVDESLSTGVAVRAETDAGGDLHVVFHESDRLVYGRRAAGAWTFETIEAEGVEVNTLLSRPAGFELDANGHAHVAYHHRDSEDNWSVRYATNASGAWVGEDVLPQSTFAAWMPNLAVDDAGHVHIVSLRQEPDELRYVTNASGSWATSVVTTIVSGVPGSQIDVDSTGAAHVVWVDSGEENNPVDLDLLHATNATGSWVTTKITSELGFTNRPAVQVDANDAVHIVFDDYRGDVPRFGLDAIGYATNASGEWVVKSVAKKASRHSFTLDAQGAVHIAHTNGDLLYTTNASGVWRTITLDTGAGGAREFERPVFEVREDEGRVSIPVVTGGVARVGIDSCVTFDAAGRVIIAYRDETLGDLKVIEQSDSPPNAESTVDLVVDGGTATGGVDYTILDPTVGWLRVDTTSKTFTIDITPDDLPEGVETATLRLTNATGGTTTIGTRSVATLRVIDDDLAPADVDSYVLPKKVKLKRNEKVPAKSALTVAGFFDTGSGAVDLAGPAELTVGDATIAVPGFVRQGSKYRFRGDGVDFALVPSRTGSSKGKFKLKLRGPEADGVDPDAPVSLRFLAGSVDGLGRVTLTRGAYKLGKVKGALADPSIFLFSAKAKLKGPGKDALTLKAGLATLRGTPAAAPDVRIAFGPDYTAEIPGDRFTRKGDQYTFKGDTDGAAAAVTLDYRKEQVVIKVKKADLGDDFPEGAGPVAITIEVGDSQTLAVRMVRKGASLKY